MANMSCFSPTAKTPFSGSAFANPSATDYFNGVLDQKYGAWKVGEVHFNWYKGVKIGTHFLRNKRGQPHCMGKVVAA